ncbi:hypothetical protein ALI44B_00275 [Leifsonia sp. ALI-44-B]|uniref:hypothetical protein n=2 Tax=Leifsonia sp. ALI-44-B TaxID=1933776 RepID=UPI00097BE432|nr:hypothetical protein [Leifsonia sp. ALI-44-B]ONI65428.1 hypothetical protein ALI44B_00275 [Leifsonia sp. ALI-44-B]
MASDLTARPAAVIAQLNGPMWTVEGRTVEVAAGVDPSSFLLEQLVGGPLGSEPRDIDVRPAGQERFTLTLAADGAITANGFSNPAALQWLRPPRLVMAAPSVGRVMPDGWALYGAHPGAGVTTWAELLHGAEIDDPTSYDGRILLVARTTLQGVETSKAFTHRAGAILMVADAPGKVPADVRRGIRVLSGVAPIIRVPWVPALRGTLTINKTAAVAKVAAKTEAAIRGNWKDTP